MLQKKKKKNRQDKPHFHVSEFQLPFLFLFFFGKNHFLRISNFQEHGIFLLK